MLGREQSHANFPLLGHTPFDHVPFTHAAHQTYLQDASSLNTVASAQDSDKHLPVQSTDTNTIHDVYVAMTRYRTDTAW